MTLCTNKSAEDCGPKRLDFSLSGLFSHDEQQHERWAELHE